MQVRCLCSDLQHGSAQEHTIVDRRSRTLPEVAFRGLVVGALGLACSVATPVGAQAQSSQPQPTAITPGFAAVILQPGPDQRRGPPSAGDAVPVAGATGSSSAPPLLGGPGSGWGGGGISGSGNGG